jgi:hypothetical protein
MNDTIDELLVGTLKFLTFTATLLGGLTIAAHWLS